ncbi:NUDIX hydrolase [Candidatus Latescibacterota bacterium]
MTDNNLPQWLLWAREIQSISQTGLSYCDDKFDKIRYHRLMEIAAEITHSHTNISQEILMGTFLDQSGYATPKIGIRGAVFRERKILLVQDRDDNRWCMPGGWADVGECPSQAVAREVQEESGFSVKPVKLIGLYDSNRVGIPLSFFHTYKIVFLCEITGGEAVTSIETSAVEFFDIDNLPPLSEERTHERHIAEAYAHVDDNIRPAAFD